MGVQHDLGGPVLGYFSRDGQDAFVGPLRVELEIVDREIVVGGFEATQSSLSKNLHTLASVRKVKCEPWARWRTRGHARTWLEACRGRSCC